MNVDLVAKRLRDLREKRSYSQTGMAKIAGVDQTTFGNWERGLVPKQWHSLTALANEFQVSVDYLLGVDHSTSPEIGEFLRLLQKLPDYRRRDLLQIAQVFGEDARLELEIRVENAIKQRLSSVAEQHGDQASELLADLVPRIAALLPTSDALWRSGVEPKEVNQEIDDS